MTKQYVFLLYFAFIRLGIDPTKHRIKSENDRLKKSMVRSKQIEDRNTLMPRLNKDAAKRFVRNGLWEIKNNKQGSKNSKDKNQRNSTES